MKPFDIATMAICGAAGAFMAAGVFERSIGLGVGGFFLCLAGLALTQVRSL